VAIHSATPEKPNIVYILCDDLGYGDVQCLNPTRGKIATPHLDKLASQGMSFTDAHSSSSVCTPTRYGILTGRYNWRTRLQAGVLNGFSEPLIAADRLTVPGLLKQNGYHTAIIGKWHLGFTLEGENKNGDVNEKKQKGKGKPEDPRLGAITYDGPVTRGFDEFFGYHHSKTINTVFKNDRVTQIIEPIDLLPTLVKHSTQYITERSQAEQPFFLYLALNSPHTPIVPSKEWQGKSGLGDYADYVMETDWAVGEVLATLEKVGVADNTLVFFTSDNGCSPRAKVDQLEAQGHFPSELRRGYKSDIWDGGHRIPFIARWPGRIKSDTRSDQLICLNNLMATCADILGTKLPDNAGEDSVSILPALLGTAKAESHEAVVHHSINGSFAIRQGNWKLELCADSGGWSDPKPGSPAAKKLPDSQLYDIKNDIGETKNLQAEHPEEVVRLTKLLEEIIVNGRSTPGSKQANDVPIKIRKKEGKVTEE
jgi:hypothetical protein